MNYQVRIADEAAEDLRAIFEYIAFELQSVQNAGSQLNRIEKEIRALDCMPERYHRYEEEPWCSRGVRYFTVDHYCVFYLTDVEQHTVDVLRVMYSRRDIPAQFKENEKKLRAYRVNHINLISKAAIFLFTRRPC